MERKLKAIPQPLPLARLAYEKLRGSILNGYLRPGEIYNEMKLANELGISRTPVREALLELSAQGLVTFLPRKGVRVNYLTKRDIKEVFELRKAIEVAVVERVTEISPKCDLTKIQKALDDQLRAKEKEDSVDFLRADRSFHMNICKLTQNKRLVSILENIRDMIHMMAADALTRPGRMEEVLEEHQGVLEFIRQGRRLEARQAMEYHLDRSKQAVLEQHHSLAEEG